MNRRIAISAGHSNVKGEDRGAIANGYVEGELAVELRDLIVAIFKQRNIPVSVDPNSNVTFQTVALFRKWFNTGNDILVDIHFNAGASSANGTLVIVPNTASDFEKDLAKALSYTIALTLGIPNKGVHDEHYTARGKLLWMSLPAESVLIEVCFLTNLNDMAAYSQLKSRVAVSIANVLIDYKTK